MSYRSRSRERVDDRRDEHRRDDRREARREPRSEDRYDDRRREEPRREEPRYDDRRDDRYDDRRVRETREPRRDDRYEDRREERREERRDDRRSRSPARRDQSRSPLPKRVSRDENGAPIPAPPSVCVGVFGLHRDTTSREFQYQMEKFGKIAHCVLVWNHKERCNKGFGFITYERIEFAEEAVKEMNGRTLDGRTVRVDFSFSKVGNKEHMYDTDGKRKTEYCDPTYRPPRYDTPDRFRGRSRSRSRSYDRYRDRR